MTEEDAILHDETERLDGLLSLPTDIELKPGTVEGTHSRNIYVEAPEPDAYEGKLDKYPRVPKRLRRTMIEDGMAMIFGVTVSALY